LIEPTFDLLFTERNISAVIPLPLAGSCRSSWPSGPAGAAGFRSYRATSWCIRPQGTCRRPWGELMATLWGSRTRPHPVICSFGLRDRIRWWDRRGQVDAGSCRAQDCGTGAQATIADPVINRM